MKPVDFTRMDAAGTRNGLLWFMSNGYTRAGVMVPEGFIMKMNEMHIVFMLPKGKNADMIADGVLGFTFQPGDTRESMMNAIIMLIDQMSVIINMPSEQPIHGNRLSLTKNQPAANRKIMESGKYRCSYCGKYTEKLTIDHIIPAQHNLRDKIRKERISLTTGKLSVTERKRINKNILRDTRKLLWPRKTIESKANKLSCCQECNALKGNMTLDEFRNISGLNPFYFEKIGIKVDSWRYSMKTILQHRNKKNSSQDNMFDPSGFIRH
jgi:5-methylcytosine-specific restriction endonuclease McrA